MRPPVAAAVEPDPDAVTLASHMLDSAHVHQTILEETIESAETGRIHESGRTACGDASNVRDPIARMPTAIELSSCPVGHLTGFWHTHVTRDQFLNPEHSLIDMSNVLFEDAGASIVTGLETSQIFYAPQDDEAARETFREVLGADVHGAQDVRDAITSGQVPRPADVRNRLFNELAPLVERRETPLVDPESIRSRVTAVPPSMSAPGEGEIAYELIECALAEADQIVAEKRPIDEIRETARTAAVGAESVATWAAREAAVEAIGVMVGILVSDYIFNRRRRR